MHLLCTCDQHRFNTQHPIRSPSTTWSNSWVRAKSYPSAINVSRFSEVANCTSCMQGVALMGSSYPLGPSSIALPAGALNLIIRSAEPLSLFSAACKHCPHQQNNCITSLPTINRRSALITANRWPTWGPGAIVHTEGKAVCLAEADPDLIPNISYGSLCTIRNDF